MAFAVAIYTLVDLILIVFAASLFAVLLHAIADPVTRRTRLRPGLSLTISSIGLAGLVAGLLVAFGSEVIGQLQTVGEKLPDAGAIVRRSVGSNPVGAAVLDSLGRSGLADRMAAFAGPLVSNAANWVGGAAFALAGGIYIAAEPQVYRSGLLAFVPAGRRDGVADTIDELAADLRHWLVGQLIVMAAVGLLTGLGAWALGLPAPVALGIIAGLLEFVPYLGPFLTAVPAVLLGLTVSVETALLALLWLVAVQQIEGYLLTPLIQRKAVSLPPAISLFALLAAGLLFGAPGVLLALPLAIAVRTVLRRFFPTPVVVDPLPKTPKTPDAPGVAGVD